MLVKNPNYDANDSNSKRYVSEEVAIQGAQSRADNVNTLTNPKTPVTADTFYKIQGGDTLGAIARANNTSVSALQQANNISNPNLIQAGASLRIPGLPQAGSVPNTNPGGQAQPGQAPAPNNQALAQQFGEGGLSIQDFQQVANRGVTENDRQGIKDTLGISGLEQTVFQRPEQSTVEMYNELYNSVGLRDFQKNLAKIDDDINKKREDLTEAIGEIKGNPWISQATRTGRLNQLQELAQNEIGNLIAQRDQASEQYDQGVSEIERTIGFAQQDFQIDRELGFEQLNYLLGEAERQEEFIKDEELANTLRYVPDYLKGIKTAENRNIANDLRLINARRDADIAVKNAGNTGGGNFSGRVSIAEDGQQILATEPPKAPTQGERQALVFFERMNNAVQNLDSLESEIQDLGFFGQVNLNSGNLLTHGPTLERISQAQKEFTEARLRKDSGAAIPPEEFANDRRTYFPQPGDSQEVLQQKRQSRNTALNAIRTSSANAYWEFYGESPVGVSQSARQTTEQNQNQTIPGTSTTSTPAVDLSDLNFQF